MTIDGWLTIIGVVVLAYGTLLWERRRGAYDPSLDERQGDYGWRLIKLFSLLLVGWYQRSS